MEDEREELLNKMKIQNEPINDLDESIKSKRKIKKAFKLSFQNCKYQTIQL